jgi:hypothetical protein
LAADVIKGCEEQMAALPKEAQDRLCHCMANRITNSITNREFQALEVDEGYITSSLEIKIQEARTECSKETLRK